MSYYELASKTADHIRSKVNWDAQTAVILGTGLGDLKDKIVVEHSFAYADIPNFPISTVQGHDGMLIFGTINKTKVIAMAGRFHYYEGYSMKEVTFPIRVLKLLGIQKLIISNVSGSVNPSYEAGDIIVVKDHINLHPENPLRGENDERFGPRFPDMLKTYSADLRQMVLKVGKELGIRVKEGVYLSLQGPNLETPAEYNFFRIIGADLIGMSTVPEVLVAKHMAMEICVLSVVSNKCFPLEQLTETTVEEVIAVANRAAPYLTKIVAELV